MVGLEVSHSVNFSHKFNWLFHRALKPPGWYKDWHCGVRAEKSGKLLGFISAIPATIRIYNQYECHYAFFSCLIQLWFFSTQKMVEINFLCVHKKLRSKRVAPVLIREITRRVHLKGIFQAVYTAGVVLPKPVSTCRYCSPFRLSFPQIFICSLSKTGIGTVLWTPRSL